MAEIISLIKASGRIITPEAERILSSDDALITNKQRRRVVIEPAKTFNNEFGECKTSNVLGWADANTYIRPSLETAGLLCLEITPEYLRSIGIRYLMVVIKFQGSDDCRDVSVFTDGHNIDAISDSEEDISDSKDPSAWWLQGFGFALSCDLIDMVFERFWFSPFVRGD
jgi:hypothetical protein